MRHEGRLFVPSPETCIVIAAALVALLALAALVRARAGGGDQEENVKQKRDPNRLFHEKSPYLLQHAFNPVDWYPWGDEAFARAKRENKPIFLSIGYSTCHWCHVMERESFEDEETAAYLNEHFVSIKVDREERPDVDTIYMTYVTARTGSGGWPLTAFLTPDRVPFFGGTYFPNRETMGHPSFMRVLRSLKEAWERDHEKIVLQGEAINAFLAETTTGMIGPGDLDPGLVGQAVIDYAAVFDQEYGGQQGAPKFPPPMMIGLLLRHEAKTGDQAALDMARRTLDGMAQGGIHDVVGGGFARYAVDDEWLVPHFEKMLYVNALLARNYAEAYQRTGEANYRKVAVATLDYLLRDMRVEGRAFAAAEDADSAGEEGLFYTWLPEEVEAVLGAELAAVANAAYGVTAHGDLDGRSVLRDAAIAAADQEQLERARALLLVARERRERPLRDDKVLAGWNGLAITAFAYAGRALGEPRYVVAAREAADFVLERQFKDGTLLRRYRDGEAAIAGQLEDYAYLVQGLIDLYESAFERRYLDAALALNRRMLELFLDPETGTFFDAPVAATAEGGLLVRPRSATDGATPAPTAVAAKNLIRLGELTMDDALKGAAERCIRAYAAAMARSPLAFQELLVAMSMLLEPPREVVFAGRRGSADLEALVAAYWQEFRPYRVLAFADADDVVRAEDEKVLELVAERLPVDGKAAVYLCENYACQAPLTDPKALGPGFGR